VKKLDKCVDISHPNLQPGWGCCGCNTYNGNQRDRCKYCNHERCNLPKAKEELN
jgi:hypothetical protein